MIDVKIKDDDWAKLTGLFEDGQELLEGNRTGTFGHINHFKLDGVFNVKSNTLFVVFTTRMEQGIVRNGHFFRFLRRDIETRFRQCNQIVTFMDHQLSKCFKSYKPNYKAFFQKITIASTHLQQVVLVLVPLF